MYLKQARPYVSVSKNGVLLPEVLQVLDLIASTTSRSPPVTWTSREMTMIVAEAKKRGITRIVITHPGLGPQYTNPSIEQMKEVVSEGAYAEIVQNELGSANSESFYTMIRTLGPAHCIISTDSGLVGTPNPCRCAVIAANRLPQGRLQRSGPQPDVQEEPCDVLGLPAP